MLLTTLSEHTIQTISLPSKISGRFSLSSENKTVATVDGINDQWVLHTNRNYKISDKEQSAKSIPLSENKMYMLENQAKEKVTVFTEPDTDDRITFCKYVIRGDTSIAIGRETDNEICFPSPYVTSHHCELHCVNGKWIVIDNRSTNGTFVNDCRVSRKELRLGDIIYIMGLKIIVGRSFIAINNPDNQIKISNGLKKYAGQKTDPGVENEYDADIQPSFSRSPRFKRDIETAKIKIDPPQTSPIGEEMPWFLVMGTSMAMGAMSIVTLVTAIINKNMTSMAMGITMLLGTLLLPMISKVYEKNRKKRKEALRQKKYKAYLSDMQKKIREQCELQQTILNENHIPVEDCIRRINSTDTTLWERSMGQNDFLRLRVGTGNGLLDAELAYSERRFSIEEDNLQEEMYHLCEAPKELHHIPITYSVFEDRISGVIGERKSIIDFAKGLIVQIATFYSYQDVKLVFIYDESEKETWDFVRWLPHVWDDEKRFRYVATNENEIKELSVELERVVDSRLEINESDMEDVAPYYVIFSLSHPLSVRSGLLKKLFANSKTDLHISVISVFDELRLLPVESTTVVDIFGGKGKIYDKDDISGKHTEFTPDISISANLRDISRILANTRLDDFTGNYSLPSMITFLELFQAGKVEHLNSLVRWEENDPTKSLETPIGINTMGEPFMLDLHEKYHGPHGLVAGMTGSGKSEFIMTYILSLAVNYHPNEVAFVLIDYKGGGMAKSFANLPHTVGIITNLDGAAIKRSLVSIESELKRRQALFSKATESFQISNIDIYKYQRLYREKKVSEPLPHLFIISDEFAELKTQQPDFMAQLVSAARIGRSLGVHLILATQKPSGVVDDQIWSNSKFRVCLKVQERSDSMDMLKRPDAAELRDTGRFYLQVGYNELFEMGQSAWAGAPYYPSETTEKEIDDGIAVIDMNGRSLRSLKHDRKKALYPNASKQLDSITKYLQRIADEEKVHIRQLWLPPIPANILVEEIKAKYGITSQPFVLEPLIGEYDDPANQRQAALQIPISAEGNVVVYGNPGSGKTSFLNAAIYSLIHEHTPEEVSIYILDFASETLQAFSKAPHVGDVILSFEREKIENLLKLLLQEKDKRRKLFAPFGGDYNSFIKSSDDKMPAIVVMINNFTSFAEGYDNYVDTITLLTREGTKYGIYFIVTSLGVSGIRFKLLQNFKLHYVLQLNDPSDYSTVLGKTDGLVPASCKGRGLIKAGDIFEFQVAFLTSKAVPLDFIRNDCETVRNEWKGSSAVHIPILPEHVNSDFLKDYIDEGSVMDLPIGVEKNSLSVHHYPFGKQYINFVLSNAGECQEFITDLTMFIGTFSGITGVVLDPLKMMKDTGRLHLYSGIKDCIESLTPLFEMFRDRNNAYKDVLEEGKKCTPFDPFILIINGMASMKAELDDTAKEQLNLILERGSKDYNITIIIADQVKALSSYAYEKWYKQQVTPGNGIWIGNGFAEQYQLKARKTTAEMRENISSGFGFSLIDGICKKIKLLSEKEEDSSNE